MVLAVPGSPSVGEFTVSVLRRLAAETATTMHVVPGESFVDVICAEIGLDPMQRGLQILDGRALPDPLPLHVPTIIAQVDVPVVAAEVLARLADVLDFDAPVTVLTDLGSPEATVATRPLSELDPEIAGLRTSLLVDTAAGGYFGVVQTMRELRVACPWDREQTHLSIAPNLVEETFELAEALSHLDGDAPGGDVDHGAYADVEEELGDVLLQVLFHAVMGEESGALRVDRVGEVLRQKLIRRHPHVFGEGEASTPAEVRETWDAVKSAEKGSAGSALDGIPAGLPALERSTEIQRKAAGVGFDWPTIEGVVAKVVEELDELTAAVGPEDITLELGDLLFSVVNLARHLGTDPAVALRKAGHRFEERFRWMESRADLSGMNIEEMEALWQAAKSQAGPE